MKKLTNTFMLFFLFAALIPAVLPEPVKAQGGYTTVEIQPDASSGYDTYMSFTDNTTNYGTVENIMIGQDEDTARGLIMFDLSTLPTVAGVVSAKLSLWVADDYATSSSTLQAFTVIPAWSETYATFTNYGDNLAWQLPGAVGEDDILPDPSGAVALTSSLTPGTRVDIPLNAEDVGNMIRENYFGFMLRTMNESSDAYDFYSSDYVTDPTMRPMLTVEYDPDPPVIDPGWTCVTGSDDCTPLTGLVSPFVLHKPDANQGSIAVQYGGVAEGSLTQLGALLNCTPYPNCKNDYPIYYEYWYDIKFQTGAYPGWQPAWFLLISTLKIPGANNADQIIENCPMTPINGGWNTQGECYGRMTGVIQPAQMPLSIQTMDISLKIQGQVDGSGSITQKNWYLKLSVTPPAPQCSQTYVVPTVDTYTIDPTIETPVGMVGDETPVDEQGFPLTIGAMYMVRTQDGPWNDGTDDRTDTAVSMDGSTYQTLEEFATLDPNVLCYDVDPLDQYKLIVYFTATTETFFIRVNDTPGITPTSAFANNSNDAETPLTYSIGVALLIADDECGAQFTYDPGEDTISSVSLHSNVSNETPELTQSIVPGDWYGIEVASGTWHEAEASYVPRIDMQFDFTYGIEDPAWKVLEEGSEFVYCSSLDGSLIFVQAPITTGNTLHIRVNDQDDPTNFTDNTGTLGVNIYHATYTHIVSGCETPFEIGDLVASGEVGGDKANGHGFANNLKLNVSTSYTLTLGGWYMLETTGGPWTAGINSNLYAQGAKDYDIQLKSYVNSSSIWELPDTWPLTDCAMKIDALGHYRVYFQAPDNTDGGAEYMIRASGAGMFGGGSIGWDLYQVAETEGGVVVDDPWDTCLSDYGTMPMLNQTWIPVKASEGTSITRRATGGGAVALLSGFDYWLYTSDGPWDDGEIGHPKYSAQISSDGGLTWYLFADHPDVQCAVEDQLGQYSTIVFHTDTDQQWRIRVADTDTTTFTDNGGSLAYTINQAVDPTDPSHPLLTDAEFEACSTALIRPVMSDFPKAHTEYMYLYIPVLPSVWDPEDWVPYLGNWYDSIATYMVDTVDVVLIYTGELVEVLTAYAGDWGQYGIRNVSAYFAWCPRHTNILLVAIHELETKEPLATVAELNTAADNTIAEVRSYDWGSSGEGGGVGDEPEDTSIFSFSEGGGSGPSVSTVNNIMNRILPMTGEGVNVWSGGDAVNFSEGSSLPEYYYTCNNAFAEFLPSRLKEGSCFVSAYWKETGAAFWLQLSFDIFTIFMLIGMIKSAAQSLIYMMTGVRPWTKDGAIKIIEIAGSGGDIVQPIDRWGGRRR